MDTRRNSAVIVTTSFGVAGMGRKSAEELMKRTDAALYAAKQNGRDRVEVAAGSSSD